VRARFYCPECLVHAEHDAKSAGEFHCERCGRAYAVAAAGSVGEKGLERCAFCGNRTFFLQKDFDQRLGCLIMGVSLAAALLVGWRFGWIWFTPALLVSVVVDWIVAAKIRPVTICYRCDAEYRDVPVHPSHEGYDPHLAERFADKKTVRRMR
jgi:hypothetical protein